MSDTTPSSLSPETLKLITAAFPAGTRLKVTSEGVEVEPEKPVARRLDLKALVEVARRRKFVTFEVPGAEPFELEVQGLSAAEWIEISKLNVTPPLKMKPGKTGPEPDGYDQENPEYIRACALEASRRRALVVAAGLVGIGEEIGKTVEEKVRWINTNLTAQILELLYASIFNLTSVDRETPVKASFT